MEHDTNENSSKDVEQLEINKLIENEGHHEIAEENSKAENHMTLMEIFWLLTKFMLPLVVTQIVPDIAEQALNRGITSIADDEMVQLLASFGLAYYMTRFVSCPAIELRNIGMVMVTSRDDNKRMTLFSCAVGLILTALQLLISLTPAGMWLIRDLHRQPEDVSRQCCMIMAYLAPVSLLESVAYYYEGALVSHKLTLLAAIAKIADFGLQVMFVVLQLFTPARFEPVIVPLYALYAGMLGRLILCVGFWLVYVRRKIPQQTESKKPTTHLAALKFWSPLAAVMLVQMITRPAINLVVSRTIATLKSKEEAAKAVAVLTAVYPVGRFLWSWLNDVRAIIPAFHKTTPEHPKLSLKTLGIYTIFCTLVAFFMQVIVFIIPGPGYFIMNSIFGLTPELAELSLVPLQIFTGLCFPVGVRCFVMGILIQRKKTKYVTPAGIARLISVVVALATLPYSGLNGATLGITCLLLSFVAEAIFLVITMVLIRYAPAPSCSKSRDEK